MPSQELCVNLRNDLEVVHLLWCQVLKNSFIEISQMVLNY